MFAGRFGTQWSWEGPQRLVHNSHVDRHNMYFSIYVKCTFRLRNVYFVFLLELRALQKVAPYLRKEMFYTGNDEEDVKTREMIEEILDIINQFPDHFDEHDMFTVRFIRFLNIEENLGSRCPGSGIEGRIPDTLPQYFKDYGLCWL